MNAKFAVLAALTACMLTLRAADDGHTDDYQTGPIDVPVMRGDHVQGFMNRHNSRRSRIAKHESKHYDIVFFGDSITHNWERKNGDGYIHGLAVWTEEFGGMEVLNCGFGGDRVENCHWRAENGELAGYKADVFLDEFFMNKDGTVKTELFNDGIHLNDAGYRIWARELKKTIASFAERQAPSSPDSSSDSDQH